MQEFMPEIHETITYASKFYYSKIALWIAVSIAIYYCIKKVNNDKIYSTLLVYLSMELFLGVIDNFISPNKNLSIKTKSYFINISNITISLIEFYFFSTLHKRALDRPSSKLYKILGGILLLFTTIIISYLLSSRGEELLRLTYTLGSIEFVFIFYLSIDYFKNSIKDIPSLSLFERGSFWCFLGSLFYCAISAPFYIVGPKFPTGIQSFDTILPAVMYYLPYTILFICISKGLQCKTQIWS